MDNNQQALERRSTHLVFTVHEPPHWAMPMLYSQQFLLAFQLSISMSRGSFYLSFERFRLRVMYVEQ